MELGDPTTDERAERSVLDVALENLDNALNGLIDTVESGGLEHLTTAEKISFWKRFENFRNRLPLIDHSLISDAEATHLAAEYNFNNLTRFLMRIFLLSHGEAAARVRAAVAVGPRSSMLGERLQPLLPKLAAVQRDGAISTEQVQIVERAMHKLSRSGLNPAEVEQRRSCSPTMHQSSGQPTCTDTRYGSLMPPTPTGRNQ